ncbi:protein PAL OF QUIRKY [Cornus florida]|uniref:protein PAL OF QUIRKY n=1 Tax=Cornus florida TaxID=4283 RepID=UPI00289C2EF2|nr:protein PAL OF QUIRKY [Cornus florida]
MDFPPPPPPSIITDAHSDTFPAVPNDKLRLMCSYGGHIVTRPHNKSLCYAGGDTRIVAVDRSTTAATLSSLTAHLSRALYNNRPFTLKYQLPNEDLDSLISVTTDEDLHNMLEENDRIVSSPNPSRIRLFLFPLKPESIGSVLLDPKAESWFCDALKGTKIMQRGQSAESGLVNGLMGLDFLGPSDSSVESLSEAKNGLDQSNVPESMALETSSSFGSTSSSISMSNLPPIGVHCEDGGVNLQNNKVKMPLSGSMESDNSVASAVSHPRTYQDPLIHVTSMDTRVSSNTFESESGLTESSSGIHLLKTVPISGYQLSSQSDQKQQQQEVQYVPAVAHYIPQYPTGPLPMSSYYPVYHPPFHQQHYSHYQPSQPYPIYLLPVRETQPHNMSVQCNLIETATAASSRPPLHPHTALITPTVTYKEVEGTPPTPELATKVYRTVQGATTLVSVPSNQKQQQFVGPPEPVHPSQSVATTTMATSNFDNEFDDNLAYNQIYKTQPSAPGLSLQYQSMMKATPVLLSEAPSQLHTDNNKQVGTSQPQ